MLAQIKGALVAFLFVGTSVFASQHQSQLKNRFPTLNEAPEPKVVIMVFADFECPFSKRGAEVEQKILNEYGSDVRIVFRNVPLANRHPNALQAAYAGLCAHQKGKFKEMHDLLFSNQKSLGPDIYVRFATELKLDLAQFSACMTDPATHDLVQTDLAEAKYGLSVWGVPTYIMSNSEVTVRMNGAYSFEEMKNEIDKLL